MHFVILPYICCAASHVTAYTERSAHKKGNSHRIAQSTVLSSRPKSLRLASLIVDSFDSVLHLLLLTVVYPGGLTYRLFANRLRGPLPTLTDPTTDPAPALGLADISLVRGGLFYRFQQTLGFIHPNRWNLGRRIAVLIAIGWVPLVAITAFANPGGLPSLFADYRVYARLFVAIPVLLSGEFLIDLRFHTVLKSINEADLLGEQDTTQMERAMAKIVHLRDSLVPELLILGLLLVYILTSYRGSMDGTPWFAQGMGSDIRLTTAGWYGVSVGTLLWLFLLSLGLWHWFLWTLFAFKLSRQNLKVVATHPDGHGGIGFLGLTIEAFAPIAFAATCVIGSTWRHHILHDGAHLLSYKVPAIILLLIIVLIALAPLFFFSPRLFLLRYSALRKYGVVGQQYSTEFQEKWIEHPTGHKGESLATTESGRLVAYGHIFDRITKLKPFPLDKGALYVLAIAVVLPLLPAVLTEIPFAVVMKDLLKALR